MGDCIFCKIASHEIPVEIIYENDEIVAFPDIDPQAPVHIVILPRHHYSTTLELSEKAPDIFGSMLKASSEIARRTKVDKSGFRLIINTNANGGQEVFHVHMHLLGGTKIGPLRAKNKG
jgi:histidine triad (HIT) family protein